MPDYTRDWRSVSASEPCPVCNKPDWCRVSEDGQCVACRRKADGGRATKDKSGVPVYVHRLNGATNANGYIHPGHARAKQAKHGESVKAGDADTLDADTRHRAYTFIVEALALSGEHREALRRRGLPDAEIDGRGYRSFPTNGRRELALRLIARFGEQICRRLPGFLPASGKRKPTLAGPVGLIVLCRDTAGRIVALKIRKAGKPKYLYLSSTNEGGPGPGAPVHVPIGVAGPIELVRLTEGELKADVATVLSGVPTISAPGVQAWQTCLPPLRELCAKTVRVAFDVDARTNKTVARALLDCIDSLPREGFQVELERWPESAGKGIDDALAAGATTEVLAGDTALAAAREIAAAAGVPIEGPAMASVSVDGVGAVALTVEAAAGSKPQRIVSAKIGSERHNDRIDVASAVSRRRFINELADKASASRDALYAALDMRLVELGAAADANASKSGAERGRRPKRPLVFDAADADRYRISEAGCICRLKRTDDDELVEIPLCNFAARIVDEVTRDDGAEQGTTFTVAVELPDGVRLPPASVTADDFSAMNWPMRVAGSRAVVRAGNGNKDLLREAIQLLSKDVQRRTVYAQTGWRSIGGEWHYLHAAGAINAAGLTTDVCTDLPDALARFALPAPPAGDELRRAILASLAVLDMAPNRITAPILAAVYRAPLGDTDFSLHVAGPSGAFKSETAALAQQHYGAGFDSRHLPANWQSTANAVEGIAFAAADALLVVDDFAPQGSVSDQARYHRDADRIFRAQGNRAGRGRMFADGRLRPAKPPRGLVLSTGEDVPKGQSVRGRLLTLDVGPGDVDRARLGDCQRDARDGLYAAAMAAYLRWLAPFYGELRDRLTCEAVELRDALTAGDCHALTPGIVANLAIGLRYLLRFAVEAGAIDSRRADELLRRGCAGLLTAATSHARLRRMPSERMANECSLGHKL